MTTTKKLDPAIMPHFTGSETLYGYGLAGDVLFTEGVKYVADTAVAYRLHSKVRTPLRRTLEIKNTARERNA